MMNIVDTESLNEVLNNNNLVLVDFWAQWCGPCRMLLPVLDEISTTIEDLYIVKINVDDAKNLAAEYNIQTLPTLILFKNGGEIASKSGFMSKSALLSFIADNR